MESKAFLFTSIPILAVILVFSYLNIQQESSLAPTEKSDEQCKKIEYNGQDRIDLLFISSEEDARYYTEYLFTVEPYKTYRSYFNINVLEEEAQCDYYKDIALLCYTDQVLDLAKQCEHDYVIILKEDSPQIRSSAYGKIISLNKGDHENSVLIHELGHALGNLAEEYNGAKIPQGSKNCQKICTGFKGPVDACTQECSDGEHFRSIPMGVMRSLITDNYGVYNIALLTELFEKNKPKDTTITGNQISERTICNKKVQSIEVYQSSQRIDVKTNNILEDACIPDKGLSGSLCVGNICNINLLFTDSQGVNDETLSGETFTPERPLRFYIEQNTRSPLVEITFDNQVIETINTAEAGVTACQL
ncbi:MAG: hypothetical protein AABX23_00945 [Nanoarchaeota archaeon]